VKRIPILLAIAATFAVSIPAVASNTPVFGIGAKVSGQKPFGPNGSAYIRNLPSGAEWLDGDRIAYRCAFTFLRYQGELVARVTFVRVDEAASYAVIFDDRMHEGQIAFDGSPGSGAQTGDPGSCPASAGYAPLNSPRSVPLITFEDGAARLETRDYANVYAVAGPNHEFRIASHGQTNADCGGRVGALECVTVIAYQDGIPAVAVYYDRLSDAISMSSNVEPPPTTTPPPPTTPPPTTATTEPPTTTTPPPCETQTFFEGTENEQEVTVCL